MDEQLFQKLQDLPPEKIDKFVHMFTYSLKVHHELIAISDKELSELLINEVWADIPVFSRKSAIVNEAIERLEKSERS